MSHALAFTQPACSTSPVCIGLRLFFCGYDGYALTIARLWTDAGTMIGAFVVDYLGPKYTMVRPPQKFLHVFHHNFLGALQITGLLLQAIIGFIMSGLYTKSVRN